jgi:hypothetical protein
LTSMKRNSRNVIFQAPLGVGCAVMVSPRLLFDGLLIGPTQCYARGIGQCNWRFSPDRRAAVQYPPPDAA